MSTTIDQRVVEMRFDNKQFEQNVNTSMSTLDKLKQKLNLSGASKGLENINAAAKNNNLSALGNAASTVASRFSAMEIMGVTALANITNQAVNAGKRMVAALTIDPVKTGFSEYELKTDSIKTIMASTTEPLEEVNRLLNELNQYSDETIYSFSDMTQNIGKFTNAGVELKDAVMAIKGISNEAAVSGANANEASRAMYNFAQALSAGYVKLIDWKSIENANMATKEFKQELIDTAVSLGTVTKSGDDMYQTLEGNSFNAIKNFNEVFQDQWMTSEVLVETLKRYADETTDIGKKAKAAAQDVTKLTQIFDIAKETAQSGWARTWELIFGDINQAKALFTPISNFINGIIDGISDFRNEILESALANPFKGMKETLDKATGAIDAATKATENLGKVVDDVIGGKWGTGQERWDALTKAGYDWAEVQNKVNEKLGSSVRHTSKLSKSQEDLQKSQQRTIKQVLEMSDAQLKNLGLTEKEIASIRELQEQSEKTGIPIESLIKDIDQLSGRSLLINSFKNAGRGLAQVFKAMKNAWTDIFPPKSTEERAKGLYNMIAALHKFTKEFKDAMINTGNTGPYDKLIRTFKGVFAAIDIVATVVAGPLKLAFKVLKAILGAFDMDILDLTAGIGDAIVGFRNWIKSFNFIENGVKAVIPLFTKMVDAVKNWVEGMKEADNIPMYIIQGLVNGLKSGVKSVVNGAIELGKSIIESVKDILGIHSPSTVFFEIGGNVIQGFINGLRNGFSAVWNTLKGFGTKCIEVLGNIDWGAVLTVGTLAGFLVIAGKFASAFQKFSKAFDGLGSMFEDVGKGVKKVLKSFSGLLSGLKFKFMAEGIKDLAISVAILVGSIIALTFFDTTDLLKAGAVIVVLIGILIGVAAAMNKLSDTSMSFDKDGFSAKGGFTGALLGLAATLLILVAVTKMIGKMDPEQAKQGFAGLATLLVMIMGVFGFFSLTAKVGKNIDKVGGMFLKLSIAMLLLIGVIKLIGMLEPEEMIKGLLAMTVFTLFVGDLVRYTKGAGKNIDKIGGMLIKIAFAMGLMVGVVKLISLLKWEEMGKGIIGMTGFALFVKLLVSMAKGAGKNVGKVGGLLLGMSTAMLIMVGVMKLIATMEWSELGKGAAGVLALTLIMTLMVKMVKTVGSNASKMTGTLLAMSLSIAILAGISVLLSMVDTKHLVKGIIAVGLLAGIVSAMILATKGAKNCMANLIVMTSAIIVLAGAIALLTLIDGNKLKTSTACLASVMAVFALLIASTKLMKSSKTLTKSMFTMVGVIAALALIVAGLSFINPQNTLGNVAALSILMLAFAGSMLILGKAGSVTKTATKALLPMLGVIAGLAIILGVMSALNVEASLKNAIAIKTLLTSMTLALLVMGKTGNISNSALIGMLVLSGVVAILAIVLGTMSKLNVEGSIKTAASISILLLAMSAALVIASKAGPLALTSAMALGAMAIVVGLLALVLGVMSALNVEGSIQTAISIGLLLTAMSAALVIASYAGPNALMSVASLALMAVVVGLLGVVLGLMAAFNVEPSIETAAALSLLLIGMSAALVLLAGVGLLGPAAFVGIGALATLIVGIGALIVGIGALFDKFPMLEEFLDKGIPILQKIGEGLGKFFGGIVGGFMEGVADSLPHLGTCLSDFMTNAQPFIEGVKQVDGTALAGIGILASAIFALTAADLVNGIVSFLSGGDNFASLGTELSNFITNASPFIEGVKTIDTTAVEGVKSLASAILMITAADLLNGITSFITGEASLAKFASQLPLLGTGIKGLVDNIGDTNLESVEPVANAVKALASAASEIPNAGGLLADLVGDNELGTFAEQFPNVGTGIKGLVDNLAGVTMDSVGPAAEAVATLAKVANEIPNTGGLLASLVGDNTLSDFASQLPEVGTGLSGFIANLGNTKLEMVKPAAEALKEFVTVADSIPNTGGLVSWFTGDNDLATFTAKIPGIGTNLAEFVTNLGNTNLEKVSAACECLTAFIKAADSIPNSGGMISWFTGDNDLADFGADMADLGGYMYDFYSEVCLVDTLKLKNCADALAQIVDVAKKTSGLDTSGVDTLKGAFDKFAEMKISDFKEKFSEGLTAPINRVRQIAEDLAGIKEYADKSGIETLRSAVNIAAAMDIGGIKEKFSESMSTYVTRIKFLAKGINDVSATGVSMTGVDSLKSAVSVLSSTAVKTMKSRFDESVDDAIGNMKKLVSAINDLVDLDTSMTSEFKNAVATLAETGVSELINTFDGSADKLQTSGEDIINAVLKGLKSLKGSIGDTVTDELPGAVSDINTYYDDFYGAGSYVVSGFASGISANSFMAAATARAMAEAALAAARKALGINSPSKEFGKIGDFSGIGFINHLKAYADKAYDASAEMGESAKSGLKESINKALSIISGKMDVQPTIRPVLDLSSVESGMGVLNGIFGDDANVGVTSNIRAIASTFGQNGKDSDLVSEIRKLRSEIKDVGGTTNNYIDGITYDDGSNISSAIETLVRAARVERRV